MMDLGMGDPRLRLIYDSAHAFGVKVNGKSIAAYGDLNMLSFHATKLFHTFEGGALVFQEDGLKSKEDVEKICDLILYIREQSTTNMRYNQIRKAE